LSVAAADFIQLSRKSSERQETLFAVETRLTRSCPTP